EADLHPRGRSRARVAGGACGRVSAAHHRCDDGGMRDRDGTRLVYSTGDGRVCPACGVALAACSCASAADEAVPAKIVAALRIEKAGRGGKTVTVVAGLPRNAAFLKALCADLKRACGT